MAQTQLDYNDRMFGTRDHNFRFGSVTIVSGAGSLAAGTVIVLDPSTGKYGKWDTTSQAVVTASGTPDTTVTLDTTKKVGVAVLLEAADATSADVTAKAGFTGGVMSDKLVLAGTNVTTVTDYVKAVLRANGIEVQTGSSSLFVAGE